MGKFLIQSKASSILKTNAKPPIVEIEFLGTGGAFDKKEKNSSVLIKTSQGTILIDSGFTVYPELESRGIIKDINYIFITHTHEDHIGSLSTLVYHKSYVTQQDAKIECSKQVAEVVDTYLRKVCGHPDETIHINENEGDVYNDINMRIWKVDTTGLHYKDLPSSGFVFSFRKNGENVYIVYSGDINVPITDVIAEQFPSLYENMLAKPGNVFILHEATAQDYPPYYPHCEFQKLLETSETFPNIFTYHHSADETKIISGEYQTQKRKLKVALNKIDAELKTKLSFFEDGEDKQKEDLIKQSENIKQMFHDEFYLVEGEGNIFDVNQVGNILVIQEELGIK